MSASTTLQAPPAAVFAVLTDPCRHRDIDGTGWVTGAVDTQPLTRPGQVFRMAMYHPDHASGTYETANQVVVLEEDRAISWRTGYVDQVSGELRFGGWWWRYDLAPTADGHTEVTLTYDWSDVGPGPRAYLTFPPFPPDHLAGSLRHLDEALSS